MSEDLVRETFEARLMLWMSANPTVMVEFENQRFEEPNGVDAAWLAVRIIENVNRRSNIGNDRIFEGQGVVNIQIMVPQNTGTKRIKQIRQSLFEHLCDRQIPLPGVGHLTTSRTEKRTRGVVNSWYSISLLMDYCYYFSIPPG